MSFENKIKALSDMIKEVNPDKLEGINAVCQLELSGEEGGMAQIKIQKGQIEVVEGTSYPPDISIAISGDDFDALLSGRLKAVTAYMSGRLKFKGDMSLVFKLQELLSK